MKELAPIPYISKLKNDPFEDYDATSYLMCPMCSFIVGNYETQQVFYNVCPRCGQNFERR